MNYKVALTVVFVVFLVALVEIIYVLWRRRRFGLRSPDSSRDLEVGGHRYCTSPTKEILYFFCWKNQTSRIDPDATAAASVASPLPAESTDAEVDEVLKWHGLFEMSRFLGTIKEEEREEMESEILSSPENERDKKQKKKKSVVCSEEVAFAAMVATEVEEATPFSTPCASPPFYTPSASPHREQNLSYWSSNDDDVVLGGQVAPRELHETRSLSGINMASFANMEPHAS